LTDCRIPLDNVTMVLGPNGSGKSSIAAAIRYALTGECELTDRRGAGIARNIRHGEEQASIDLVTSGPAIMRTISTKGATVAVDSKAGDDARAALEVLYPAPELLRCMLSSWHFIGLAAKEQQSILTQLAGKPVDGAWVLSQLDEQQGAAIADLLAQTNLQGPDLLDYLYKGTYGARTELNKRVKATQAAIPAETPEPVTDEEWGRLDAARNKAHNRLVEAQAAVNGAQTQIAAHQRAKAACEECGETLRRAREALRLADAPEGAPNPDAVEAMRAAEKEVAEELEQAKTAKAQVAGSIDLLVRQANTFAGAGTRCAALQTLECPLTPDQREEARLGCVGEVELLQARETSLAGDVEDAEGRLSAIREQLQEADEAARRCEQQTRERADAEADIARLSKENERLTLVYQQTPAADPATLEANVAEAQKAYDAADAAVRAAGETRQAAQDAARARAEHKRAKRAAECMDGIVKALSPAGLPAQAMAETVGLVVEAINRLLREYTDWQVVIEPGSDFELVVTDGEYVTPVSLLSESEKLRVGAAIQVAFAVITEFGFVVVDAADRLDADNRGPLIEMLMDAGEEHELQAVIAATSVKRVAPQADGLTACWLTDGGTAERIIMAVGADGEEGEAA